MIKILSALVVAAGMATAADASVVNFNALPARVQALDPIVSEGLTFTNALGALFVWGGDAANSNGTNNLVFSDLGGLGVDFHAEVSRVKG